jgi:hypothetical protein
MRTGSHTGAKPGKATLRYVWRKSGGGMTPKAGWRGNAGDRCPVASVWPYAARRRRASSDRDRAVSDTRAFTQSLKMVTMRFFFKISDLINFSAPRTGRANPVLP